MSRTNCGRCMGSPHLATSLSTQLVIISRLQPRVTQKRNQRSWPIRAEY